MTGFGDAQQVVEGLSYAVELRSLNNRYLKTMIRLPEELAALEPELEALLRKRIIRGTVALTVYFKDTTGAAAYEINEAALQRYLQHLDTVERQAPSALTRRGEVTIDLGSLLALPGIVQPPDQTELVQRSRTVLAELTSRACDKMFASRESEGVGLTEELRKQCDVITSRLERIAARAPSVVEEYHQRLRGRIEEMVGRAGLQISDVDVVREVALHAERCDINEELQRLRAHLEGFEHVLADGDGEPVGRRLDFIAQELLREANTIASKANDAEISHVIVEVKAAIDRVKEQVQNVE